MTEEKTNYKTIVVTLSITSVLSIVGTIFVGWYQNRINYVDVFSSSPTVLINEKAQIQNLQLYHGKQTIDNLTSYSVWLINRSSVDFDGPRFIIVIHNKNDKPLRLLSDNYSISHGIKSGAQEVSRKQLKNGYEIEYKCDVLNRGDENSPGFTAVYSFEGTPQVTVEAISPDGLIEAFTVDSAKGFALSIQWHPEWQFSQNELSTAIFKAFGNACRQYAAKKQV